MVKLILAAMVVCSVFTPRPVRALDVLTVSKTPFERFLLETDFVPIGSDAFTIVSVTANVKTTKADVSSSLIASAPAPAIVPGTNHVTYMVQNGVSGQTYEIRVHVQDSVTSERYEGVTTLSVQ